MKMRTILGMCMVLALMCGTAAADWNVTWTPVKESIIDKEYIIEVQNLQNTKQKANISSFFAETSFDISKLKDIKFYEWGLTPYTYTVDHYDEMGYLEYDSINDTYYIREEKILNSTEIVESEKLDWEECKAQSFTETSKTKKDNYGLINIPKFGSKNDGDGTYNGTKRFLLKFKTPITAMEGGYGSGGKVAALLDGIEYHPYWDTAYTHYKDVLIKGETGAGTDYQVELTIGDSAGGDFHLEGHCTNYPQDIVITNSDSSAELDFWIEDVAADPIVMWIKVDDDLGSNQTIRVYYGKSGATTNSDGDGTFGFFDDFPGAAIDTAKWDGDTGFASVSGNILTVNGDSAIKSIYSKVYNHPSDGVIIEYKGKPGDSEGWTRAVGSQKFTAGADAHKGQGGIGYYDVGQEYVKVWDYNGNSHTENLAFSNVWTDQQVQLKPTEISVTASGVTSSISNTLESHPVGIYFYKDWQLQNFRVRKYNDPEPAFASAGAEQSYAGSIHYNSSTPYNHSIESDGTITANRSITASDDINWTAAAVSDDCQMIVTEYNLSNATVANFTLYNASLDWLKVTNLTVGVEYKLTNNTIYESHIADANGEINFTNNLIPDDYQIMLASTIVNITCYSASPETLYTNYTGLISGSYIVESNYPLNYSSLAFLMGTNYTLTDDYHSYLKVPANSVASDGIYRAHHRNTTPYLSWEGNDTITEGNVWKWGGGDNDSFWISKESINATHTWVNITGIASNVFPSMYYLGRLAMYEAPKTGVEINKGQGIVFKIWNLEQFRGRNCDYWVRMFFDTQIETTPSDVIDIWYCNNSFDPTSDDPLTCEYCQRLDSWSSDRWLDHEAYQPSNRVSYSKPLIYYAGEPLTICPDDINYIYLTSETQSSKSYILNATNSDPGICNITYAETQTMWLRDEVAGTNTPYAYTPSFFMATVRDYLEFAHHLYIANDQDVWGHSAICTVPIGISNVPPTHCRYNYFWWDTTTDYYMNGSYTNDFWINLTYGLDPDNGAPLTHVLSLYDDNSNFIAFINDSLEGNATDVDVFFDITGHVGNFQLKIVSTDNENSTSTSWSPVFYLGTGTDEEIPLNMFIVLMWITFASLFYIYHVETYVSKIVTSLITTWMSFMLASMIVSGNVVLHYAELTTADAFAHGSTAIQIEALSHFFMFMGAVSALFMLTFAVKLVIDTYLDMQERKITIEEWDGVEQ